MAKIFFDIETYSPDTTQRPQFNEKIITIAYKTENSDIIILKEWELGEKEVIKRFIDKIVRTDRPNLVGHNILRFDIPVLISRSLENGLGSLNDLMTLFLESYPIDTIQCLLPANRLYFSGLGLRNCADYLGLVMNGCHSTEIKEHYENGNYEAIIHHNIEDVLITEKLHDHILSSSFKPFKD
ncbi:MAG: ribonuclease H-like domain-containing protein [Candidatus Hodarchaeota archaeon]